MNTSLVRVVAALIALTFIVAACASDTGAQWTYAPVVAQADSVPDEDTAGDDTVLVEEGDVTPPGVSGAEVPDGESAEQELVGEADPAEAAQAESGSGDTVGEAPPEEAPAEGEAGAPGDPGAGPRVIELVATAALQFTDPSGAQVTDIPVTPGETVVFRIDNTAGFEHNFYIGTEDQLSTPSATTDVGIPNWTSGVKELEWVVPEDVTGLKFGCTVPGHYALMQGTFSAGAPSAEPADASAPDASAPVASEAPSASDGAAASGDPQAAESAMPDIEGHEQPAASSAGDEPVASPAGEPGMSADPAASGAPAGGETGEGGARVIDLVATASLQFTDPSGAQVTDIPVTPGETILFRVDNTSNFEHNLYIGTDAELSSPSATTDTGIPNWTSGVQELEWTVPDDITGLKFGCTVPGHYTLMQGTFSASA